MNLFKRIDGLIRIARKRQESDNEQDKLIGRQVERNLKMVKKIIGEELTFCANCKYRMEFDEAMEENLVSPTEASEMFAERGGLRLRLAGNRNGKFRILQFRRKDKTGGKSVVTHLNDLTT